MPLRLKSLELQGYKTFASRTNFEFARKVTAVVGPNGSGKSNIADSLRWVLGEQSYSLLRGKKTEDMIFSGSEQRSRAGMASATVLFDNSDGWLPIDFSEVAITRRAYRDGTNEYLVNGQRVRLKDVSELLAQSGLAERTYTIIGQGVVDAALALKAEERRRLFEEAAGIGLHRARREEALRRLDVTRRNLERVEDILAELQPRLRSLERQARRLQEFEQVRTDLQVLLREWYGYHWHLAQGELVEARDAARSQELILEQARKEQSSIFQRLSGQREKIQSLRASLNDWHRQLSQLHNQKETLNRQNAVSDERRHSLNARLNQTQEELTRLEEEHNLHQEGFERAGAEAARLEEELAEALRQADGARKALQERQVERMAVEKSLQSARQNLSDFLSRQGQTQARLTDRQNQLKRLEEGMELADKALQSARLEGENAQLKLQKTAEALEAARRTRQQAESERQQQRQAFAEAQSSRQGALDQRSAADAHLARLRAQLDVLDQAEAALSGYSEGAQALIKAIRQERLAGARGALSTFLEVPPEYETAMAAALGDYLDAVLVDRGDTAEAALDVLLGEQLRGAILPLDGFDNALQSPAVIGDSPGILGWALDLVKIAPDLHPVLKRLLAGTLIASDRAAAARLLTRLRAVRTESIELRVVTLRGEIYHVSGPILAGSSGRPAALSRPRQRRELASALETAEQRLRESQSKFDAAQALISGLQEQNPVFEKKFETARLAQDQAEQAQQQARLALESADRQLKWQVEQRARQEQQQNEARLQVEQLRNDLTSLEAGVASGREEVRRENARLAELALDDLQAEAAHWFTLQEVAGKAVAEAGARQEERWQLQQRAATAIRSGAERIEQIQAALRALDVEKIERQEEESVLATQIQALSAQIEPAEAELAAAESEQEQQLKTETTARQFASAAEHRHAQARINLAKRQEALDTWRRRIEDDFGLVAFEYESEVSGPTPLPLQGMVEQLPRVTRLSPEVEENVRRQKAQLRRIGPINPEAQTEYHEVKERFEFLNEQVSDLQKAEVDVRQVITELDALTQRELKRTFDAVAEEFSQIFTRLFGGGSARLLLTDPDDMTNTGIEIEARLPGRRTQGLSLLSGGERSLTATSLIFALLKVSPTPFCVLDEVDAMLDEANVGRFRDILREFSETTQFIIVTHNRNTVQVADVIYGVTMGRDSASQVISLKLDEVASVVEANGGRE